MKSYLTKRGYVIIKSEYDDETLTKIRKDLNVKPNISTDFCEEISFGPPISEIFENYKPQSTQNAEKVAVQESRLLAPGHSEPRIKKITSEDTSENGKSGRDLILLQYPWRCLI